MKILRAFPNRSHRIIGERQFRDRTSAADDFGEKDAIRRLPEKRTYRAFATSRAVQCIMAVGGDSEQVAAVESFIAHQAFNEGDRFTIRRPPRNRQLQRRLVNGSGVALRAVDLVNLRDPPIVVAWTWRGSCYEHLVVG